MFVRSKARSIALILLLLIHTTQVVAQNFQCAADLNNDADLDDIGELESCLPSTDRTHVCPIQAIDCETETVQTCPLGANIPCTNGQCSSTTNGSCRSVGASGNDIVYLCPETGESFIGQSEAAARQCSANCRQTITRSCISDIENFTCPLGDQYSCKTTSRTSIPQCSPNTCQDISIEGVINTIESVDSSMYVDNGEKNAEGACLGETRIFSGRPMSCRLPGVVSAYKNCCTDNNGKIYHDSKGNIVEDTLTNKAIIATAAAAWAAGSAYATALSSGATAGTAAQSGGQAFVNSLQGAFDPTTLAIAVAIALITNWLANACDQESMETAALKASGYCFRVGNVCTSRWLGSCVQREEVNCCYNSMLSRIVNEQGLLQLIGQPAFSNVELTTNNLQALDCGGFTPEQFQALDFQRIDFTEYEAEINTAVTERIDTAGDDAIERFINNEVSP
jgi:conjugal transfer mating pair stabilization protein TraN